MAEPPPPRASIPCFCGQCRTVFLAGRDARGNAACRKKKAHRIDDASLSKLRTHRPRPGRRRLVRA
jgi:hypothetical protein